MAEIQISSRQICVSCDKILLCITALCSALHSRPGRRCECSLSFQLVILVYYNDFWQRILCFELVAKSNSNWCVIILLTPSAYRTFGYRILKHVKSAIGETDVPDSLPEFISQRRRWLNGSFFAATYAIAHVGQILQSGHSLGRKCALLAQTVYNVINLIASWFAIVSSRTVWSHSVSLQPIENRATSTFFSSSLLRHWKIPRLVHRVYATSMPLFRYVNPNIDRIWITHHRSIVLYGRGSGCMPSLFNGA